MKNKLKCISLIILILILISLITVLLVDNNINIKKINKSVVYIEIINQDVLKSGSGFVYKDLDDKQYIVTSYHVIENYDEIYVHSIDRKKTKASVIGYDEYTDIAVLSIEKLLNLKEIKLGNSDYINKNDNIYVVGTPLSIKNINKVTKGKVINKEKITINTTHGSSNLDSIEINAKVDYGNSGGPLLNKKGEVVGLMFVKEESKDKGYALPINLVIDIVEKIINKELKRPNLGAVMCNTTNIELLKKYNIEIPNIDGVVILELKELGVLHNAGLQKGDIITKFNDNIINNVNELREELYEKELGKSVEIEYYKNGNYYKKIIKL